MDPPVLQVDVAAVGASLGDGALTEGAVPGGQRMSDDAWSIIIALAFVVFFIIASFTAMVLNWRDDRRR